MLHEGHNSKARSLRKYFKLESRPNGLGRVPSVRWWWAPNGTKESYISHGSLGSVICYSKLIGARRSFFTSNPWTKFLPDTIPLTSKMMEENLYWTNSRNFWVGWSLAKPLHSLPALGSQTVSQPSFISFSCNTLPSKQWRSWWTIYDNITNLSYQYQLKRMTSFATQCRASIGSRLAPYIMGTQIRSIWPRHGRLANRWSRDVFPINEVDPAILDNHLEETCLIYVGLHRSQVSPTFPEYSCVTRMEVLYNSTSHTDVSWRNDAHPSRQPALPTVNPKRSESQVPTLICWFTILSVHKRTTIRDGKFTPYSQSISLLIFAWQVALKPETSASKSNMCL